MSRTGWGSPLQLTVLGLLTERSGYGYDLQQRLDRFSNGDLDLSRGAVYNALAALEKERFAEAQSDTLGDQVRARRRRGSPRIVYEATEAGREHFATWMQAGCALPDLRDEFIWRLLAAREEDVPQLIEAATGQEQSCLEQLEEYKEQTPDFESLRHDLGLLGAAKFIAYRDSQVVVLKAHVDFLRQVRKTLRAILGQMTREQSQS